MASPSVVRFAAYRSRGSRRRSRASMPRFLAMAASASICRSAQLGRRMAFARRARPVAADPSRPSAGGASPYVETSDVLCRAGSACARVPPLAFAASPPDLRQDAKLDHPRQIFVRRRRVRSDSNPKIRTPSTGRDAQPYGWVKRGSRSLDVCWTLPRTLSPDPMKLPIVRDGASEPCYRATPRFASRLPSALRERCFSPTSATDFS